MIVSFLCLIGPGALSCLVHRSAYEKDGMKLPATVILLEVVAYSMVNMVVTVLILHPLGEAEILILPNGMPSIRYYPPAMFLSMFLALVMGLWEKRTWTPGYLYRKRKKRKYVVYAVAAATAAALLIHPMSSFDRGLDMRIGHMPIRINGVFYDGEYPVYVSGGLQTFISYRALAKGLGLDYGIKSSGLFRIEYYLGNDVFIVNRMTPGNDFYMKNQELYISLDYLRQGKEFSDIHVNNEPVLADGSSREMIYIDNEPLRYDVGWMENLSASYADSVDDETLYVSSEESFEQDYAKGCRMFAVDLQTAAELWVKKSIHLLKEHSDAYLMIDLSRMEDPDAADQLALFVKTAEDPESDVLTRTLLQVSSEKMFDAVADVFHWSCVIYDIHDFRNFSERDFLDFACREGIRVVAGDFDSTHGLFVHELLERNIKMFQYKQLHLHSEKESD